MWLFILIYILGLNISQAAGSDNSTQIYFVKLQIEESAIGNITDLLRPFVNDANLHVDEIEKTTTCQNVSGSTECSCESGYRWSDALCESNQKCCGDRKCTFSNSPPLMCVADTAATVTGTISVPGNYSNCLAKNTTQPFKDCNNKLLGEMKAVYSTIKGFVSLTISSYRVGSIIATFEMTVASNLSPTYLTVKSKELAKQLDALLVLETSGVVQLKMPSMPVFYQSEHTLTCSVREELESTPVWQLHRDKELFNITNGSESTLTFKPNQTDAELKKISELWAGEYTCFYHQESNVAKIIHKASAVMDVCLLPNIEITSVPSFPLCKEGTDLLNLRVECQIKNSNEEYKVEWYSESIKADLREVPLRTPEGAKLYAVQTVINCDPPGKKYEVKCSFTNRCNQTRNSSVEINIIGVGEPFCKAADDWEDTKAGFTAELRCKGAAGVRRRKCNVDKTWEKEVSFCVNRDVNDVLEKALIADIGLGTLDENAARVFLELSNVTVKSKAINSLSNVNASVQVLVTLSEKQRLKPNSTSAENFLDSSSNLLDRSLNESWTNSASNNNSSNSSLAERYLFSVERIIHVADIEGIPQKRKKNIQVAIANCSQGSECITTAFGVTVDIKDGNSGSVKTAGFKDLENYLPNSDEEFKPNSIVVSTTTENTPSDEVEVTLNFTLHRPRPPNVEIKCVAWDNSSRGWSEAGCEWKGEGVCVCRHLSSFAILMSKFPLEIPGIDEVTYAALAISVISLILSLAIELTVWVAVVKTSTLYLRHTAHVNISLCLLVADMCFLASSRPKDISPLWCKTTVVLKHFCYLAMFFWMFCLSTTLLHQAVFPFHSVSKKNYLKFALVVGYVCPFLIVTITFLANQGGAEGYYFSMETCWLVYTRLWVGSIHTFVLPVAIIVFINIFSMLVVIMKLVDRIKIAEASRDKEKTAALTVMRSVIFLTPVFGVTWIFGLAVMLLDLTDGPVAFAVNYIFTLLNGLQGLFILLTTCLGDKLTRDALLSRMKLRAPASITESSTKLDSALKK
ncbi:adhesion G protein-coupled receptor F5 isoform X2 [Acanthopagrus latus]|uniref:adhesion G protein-coupled receptor F5 isoform X2 n=1 Tax=Acanthopagrus latus TaxID=8177 RepID=UPI00187C9DD2|nr:adhesion G protein-coupled receptor F5 isoform X2 [Acanthopagrus latus]